MLSKGSVQVSDAMSLTFFMPTCMYIILLATLIRQSLPLHTITTLVHALICSRIDFGNAVYIGLSSTNTSKLQSILNAAARLIGGIAKFDHISYFIRDSLHWLPIHQHIQIKVCSLMRSCLAGSAPHYLRAFCTPVSSLHSRSSLRSSQRRKSIHNFGGDRVPTRGGFWGGQ